MLGHTLVMLALRSLRQKKQWMCGQPGLHRERPYLLTPTPTKKASEAETERDGQTDRRTDRQNSSGTLIHSDWALVSPKEGGMVMENTDQCVRGFN